MVARSVGVCMAAGVSVTGRATANSTAAGAGEGICFLACLTSAVKALRLRTSLGS